jgi:signal transduction histidine kinase
MASWAVGRRCLRAALCLIVCLIAPLAPAVEATVPALSGSLDRVPLSGRVGFLVDPSARLSVAEVAALAQAGGMQRSINPTIPMFRVDRGEAFWLKLDVPALDGAPSDWLLEIEKPPLDSVQLYRRSGEAWESFPEVGAALPFSSRLVNHRHYVFPVRIEPGGITTFFVRVRYAGPATPKATLWRPAALEASNLAMFGFSLLFFGFAAGMLLYNILLYVAVKNRGYLLYSGAVLCTALAFAAQSGVGAQYLWGEFTWWNSHAMYMMFAGALFFSATLTRHFLKTRQRWRAADRALRVLAVAAAIGLATAMLAPSNVAAMLIIAVGVAAAVLVPGVALVGAWRGWPGAVYFCAAWFTLYLGAVLTTVGRVFGFLPDSVATNNSVAVSAVAEMLLLSLALANRINDERRQKVEAQSLALAILKASHALGSETRLDHLHTRLCAIMAELTGATAVRLILWDPDSNGWYLYRAAGAGTPVPVEAAVELGPAAIKAVHQVAQTGERVSIEGISVLLPVVHHGAVRAMLLLEQCRQIQGALPASANAAIEGIAGPLAVSLQNVLLYERLEKHVQLRTSELQATQRELVATARRAGMAEISTNVLHNVGNTLNSVNVSAELMRPLLARRNSKKIAQAVDLLDQNCGDLAGFLGEDPKGKVVRHYLRTIAEVVERERQEVQTHLEHLITRVDHIKKIVATQQAYASPVVLSERVAPAEIFEDALRISWQLLHARNVEVVRHYDDIGQMAIDKTRALQVLTNLVQNASEAMSQVAPGGRRLTVRTAAMERCLRFEVEDSGCGIAPENMARIFVHGFTTRTDGHGFGLHGSAIAAREMGGTLTVHSDGPGRGAKFTLELPTGDSEQ